MGKWVVSANSKALGGGSATPISQNGVTKTTTKGLGVAWPPSFGLGVVLTILYDQSKCGRTIPMALDGSFGHPHLGFPPFSKLMLDYITQPTTSSCTNWN